MLKAIISYLNLKLGLLNYFDATHCLSELKADNEGRVAPKEYIGSSEFKDINLDEFNGVSYWRLRSSIDTTPTDQKYRAGKTVDVTVPLKLVFSVPREKLTTDDAYAFDRIRQTITKQLNVDDGILKMQLGSEKVLISTPSSNGDPKEVWDGETDNTGELEPNYRFVFGSIDVDVKITYRGECLPTECDDIDSNILHAFNFCKPAVQDQLTPEQITCLEDFLCSIPEDATVQLNGVTIGTVASGATGDFDVTQDGSPVGSWNGTAWIIPLCPDPDPVTEQINGVTIGTAASGSTNNQVITDTATNPVGTGANPSVIADTSITSSLGNFTDTALAESTYTIANVSWTDSDGSPQSTEYSGSIVCAPPNYGTKILTVLQRQYGVSALWGFSYRELSDEYIDVDIVLFRRSGDNATASYTATEIIDGTLEAWVVAGGGTQHGYRVSFYDQTSNDRLLRISTAGNQPIIVESGILLVDSNGNPQERLTWTSAGNIQSVSSTFVYSGQVSRFGGMWHVGKRVVTASATYMIDSGGNPAVGIAQTSALVPNNGAAGTITVVNGTTLSPNTRTQLKTVTEGIETITFMKSLNWGASVWSRVGATISQQLAGSTFSETVAFNQNPSAYEALIQTDLNNYYAYY